MAIRPSRSPTSAGAKAIPDFPQRKKGSDSTQRLNSSNFRLFNRRTARHSRPDAEPENTNHATAQTRPQSSARTIRHCPAHKNCGNGTNGSGKTLTASKASILATLRDPDNSGLPKLLSGELQMACIPNSDFLQWHFHQN